MSLADRLQRRAQQRALTDEVRTRRLHGARTGMHSPCDGRTLLNFSSNDYLGFAQHPAVVKAFQDAAETYGVGSAGSALVSGYFAPHQNLERTAAELFGYEACLYTGSGYLANTAILQTLLGARSHCVQDKRNHACLIDGALHSGARVTRFPHRDMAAAEALCAKAETDNLFLVSDGVFSMDGDCADLNALSRMAEHHNATLMIDDAHGVGVCGSSGLGSVQAAGLSAAEVPLLVVPCGKALGGQGALILSNKAVIEELLQSARPYLFSTAPAPAMAAAISTALQLLQQAPEHHARLRHNIAHFVRAAAQAGLPLLPSNTAIQPLMAGSNARALYWSKALSNRGIWLSAIRPPTVPQGQARLRITLSACHQLEDIEHLLAALADVLGDPHAPA